MLEVENALRVDAEVKSWRKGGDGGHGDGMAMASRAAEGLGPTAMPGYDDSHENADERPDKAGSPSRETVTATRTLARPSPSPLLSR